MTVTLTYEPILGRVRINATALGTAADYATVEQSTDQIRWTTVRGGSAVPVTAGAFVVPLDSYEFSPNVINYYRVRGIDTALITFVAAGTASTGSSGSRTPGAPAGIVAGDLLICLASTRNSGTGTVNVPAGWTQLVASGNVALLGKRYDGSEAMPTITYTGGAVNEDTLARIAAWRNAELSPIATNTQLNGSAQNIAYPALTVADDNLLVIVAGWKQDDWTSVATLGGAVEVGETTSTAGSDAGQVWDYQIETTAASWSAGSFSVTGGAAAISRGMIASFRQADYITEQTASITPILSGLWIKSIARPFLNAQIELVQAGRSALFRPARSGVFDIVGRSFPIAVNDVRKSKRWVLTLRTTTPAETDALNFLLASGDVLLIQAPPSWPVPTGYVTVGDVDQQWHPLRPERITHNLPVIEVAPPGPDVVGSTGTWQTVLNSYSLWSDLILDNSSWSDLLTLIGSGSEVIVA